MLITHDFINHDYDYDDDDDDLQTCFPSIIFSLVYLNF